MFIAHLLFAIVLSGIDPTLEKAITAIDENAAKITHGRATYTVEKRNDGSEKIRESVKVETYFSESQYAWQKGDWKYVWSPAQVIEYFRGNRQLPENPDQAKSGNSVFISSHLQSGASPWLY
ncbi:hypothetical protein K2Y11_20155, partial [bacterium]|nr:hypothetical protein [bacterium]